MNVWHLQSRVMSEPAGEDVTYWFTIVATRCFATHDVLDNSVPFDGVTAERSESATIFMER